MALERIAGVGVYESGECICKPPNMAWQIYDPEKDGWWRREEPGLCPRCGLKQRILEIIFKYDDDPPNRH
jgi:hypothetical protein